MDLDTKICRLLDGTAHVTDWYAQRAACSLGVAALALLRLERAGKATRGVTCPAGMTWKARVV